MGPRKKAETALQKGHSEGFASQMLVACFSVSGTLNTRKAYWSDARRWLDFCRDRSVDPATSGKVAVIGWIEEMKREAVAPKTRARRVSALASIYEELRRDKTVEANPFSVHDGPARERVHALAPTQLVSPDDARAVLATCGNDFEGWRDEAILRLLWATGARRASIVGMTFERLRSDGKTFEALLIAKGGKEVKILIRGKAADALKRWIDVLHGGRIEKGSIWRAQTGAALDEKAIWRMLRKRARKAGVQGDVTPHMFRVAFLTINPASLDAKQDAAGHSDPATTRLYDRSWRGREAFEAMPEIEEA